VLLAERRDARIVNPRAGDMAGDEERTQGRPMRCRFGRQCQGGRFEPCLDLVDRAVEGRGRRKDSGWVTMARNSCRHGHGIAHVAGFSLSSLTRRAAVAWNGESSRCA
jgi:hypothetical protein